MALNFKAQQIEILTHKNSHVNVVRSCLETPEKKAEREKREQGKRAKSNRLPIAGRDERRGALEFFVHASVLVLVLLLFILILILALVLVLVLVLVSGT